MGGEHALTTLADWTGGRTFYPSGFAQLDAALGELLQNLRTQYLITYRRQNVPEQPDRFHAVRLTVKGSGLRVMCRSGYYEK
jgi:hypothetical protein